MQMDVWTPSILDWIAPIQKHNVTKYKAYSYLDEAKYGKKSSFLKGFYKGDKTQF